SRFGSSHQNQCTCFKCDLPNCNEYGFASFIYVLHSLTTPQFTNTGYSSFSYQFTFHGPCKWLASSRLVRDITALLLSIGMDSSTGQWICHGVLSRNETTKSHLLNS